MKTFRHPIIGLVAAGLMQWSVVITAEDRDLRFEQAWIRAMPPGMNMTAGFGTLRNRGAAPVEITAFSSPQFGEVSLHRSETVAGVSRMREVPSLVVAPGASVELAPGGYHLMLMMPVTPLSAGAPVRVFVTTRQGREFRFDVPVERR